LASTLEVPSWAAAVVATDRIARINRFFIFIYSFGFSVEGFDGNAIIVRIPSLAKLACDFSTWEVWGF
jgi:hypothetical protein